MLPNYLEIQWAGLWLFAGGQNILGWQLLKVGLNNQKGQDTHSRTLLIQVKPTAVK